MIFIASTEVLALPEHAKHSAKTHHRQMTINRMDGMFGDSRRMLWLFSINTIQLIRSENLKKLRAETFIISLSVQLHLNPVHF